MRSTDSITLRIIDIWSFRSSKSRKRYIVEVEHFDKNFLGLKFYWKGVESSKDRYSLLTNDYEPRTIAMSCVEVMLDYYRRDEFSSFGFVGAPDLDDMDSYDKPTRRFRFYRRMMLTLFSSLKFIHVNDINGSVYILVNRRKLESGDVTLKDIEIALSRLYVGEYSLSLVE